MTKKTAGQVAVELTNKLPDTRDPIALEREAHKEYESNVIECLERSKKEFPDNFFVVVLVKREKKLPNILRNLYFARESCPPPHFDQTVYHYVKDDDALYFCWTLPDEQTCESFRHNVPYIDPLEYELLENILNYYDGSLSTMSDEYNEITMKEPILN